MGALEVSKTETNGFEEDWHNGDFTLFMIITGTCGTQTVNRLDHLLNLLQTSRNGEFAEFWMGVEKFPALVVNINGELASVHYFPAERHPGFQALGDRAADGDVIFEQEGHGSFSLSRASVVPVTQAYDAAGEFFTRLNLPKCIKWREL